MSVWRGAQPLMLASQSAARRALLSGAGFEAEAIPADIDERAIQQASGLSHPGEIAALLAEEKSKFVSRKAPGRYVIGADQTLALGTRLFSKPADLAAAAQQIAALAGRTHELHSAVSVTRDGAPLFAHVSVARMTMRRLSDAEIAAYIHEAGDAVLGSVGAYQLERTGIHLFAGIEGDHSTILGLPLLPLLAFLRGENLLTI